MHLEDSGLKAGVRIKLCKQIPIIVFTGIWILIYWSFILRVSVTAGSKQSYFRPGENIFWEGFVQFSWKFQDLLF